MKVGSASIIPVIGGIFAHPQSAKLKRYIARILLVEMTFMDEDYFPKQQIERLHEHLFSEYSLKLGKILWYILKADNEVENNWGHVGNTGLTDLGKEIGKDPMHWWVFKRESEIDELQKRTKHTLIFLQMLKNDSQRLSKNFPRRYEDLISILREFAESHRNEIDAFYEYVIWLHNKDILAPSILYTGVFQFLGEL